MFVYLFVFYLCILYYIIVYLSVHMCNTKMATGRYPGRSFGPVKADPRKVQGKKSETDEPGELLTAPEESLPKNEGPQPEAWKFLISNGGMIKKGKYVEKTVF